MAAATRFLEAANLVAALRVPLWRPVACDAVAELREDGTRHWAKFLSARITASASLTVSPTVVRRDGTVDAPPVAPAFNGEAGLVLRNGSVRQALSFLQEASWASLYKAYEIVRDAVGGDRKLRSLGWASGALISRFRHTCQSPAALGTSARHAVEPATPPSRPLEHAEARNLVATLVAKWIDGQLEVGAKPEATDPPNTRTE